LSKIKNLGFGCQINQMRSTIQDHIGKEFGLIHLTGLGTGDSNPDGDLVFHQIRQIIIRAISGSGVDSHVPGGIGPFHPIIDEKNIYLMTFGMGDFGELKTSCSTIHNVFA
jgi:hypothetical protein